LSSQRRSRDSRATTLAFHDVAFLEAFDVIWACASLVHVPEREAPDVMRRFTYALKRGGILYISLKEGDGERIADDGRFFCYYGADAFRNVTTAVSALRELAVWTTDDVRSPSDDGRWLNFLLKKTA
jgi:hypothetical protein